MSVRPLEDSSLCGLGLLFSKQLLRSVETNFGKTIKSLPTRFLAPGNLRMLYEQWGRRDVSCFGWTPVLLFIAPLMVIMVIETTRKLTAATRGVLHAFKE